MKAIIELADKNYDPALEAAKQFDAGKNLAQADYYLRFENTQLMFSHLTAARLELLENLRKIGACSIYALAKAAGRNYSNVHRDIKTLEALNLIERTANEQIYTPFAAIDIRLQFEPLAANS